jgi:spore germination protein KA
MIFIEGLIAAKNVDDDIHKPLTQEMSLSESKNASKIIEKIEHGTLYHVMQKTRAELSDCINDIIDGSVALVFDQVNKAITFDVKGFENRSISEPTSENVFKGAKDSFVENLRTNTATIRRKIKTHNLVIEETKVGKQSLTKIAIVYINGITNMSPFVGEENK